MTTEPTLPATSVDHMLTDDERDRFNRDGFIALPDALDAPTVGRFLALAHGEAEAFHTGPKVHPYAFLNLHDLIGRDRAYLDLIDWPTTFPKVFGVLGWNIQLFHTQLVVNPPGHPDAPRGGYAWHQDNNRMNLDFETPMPHPRVSVKLAYFLTELGSDGMGNFCVIPGSHRDAAPDATRAVEVTAHAGDAMLFDRRLWHSASSNHSDITRVVLFVGYSYRWLRPKSAMNFPDLLAESGPIRRQLLGAATGANGHFDPTPDDVPLRQWIREHLGDHAVAE